MYVRIPVHKGAGDEDLSYNTQDAMNRALSMRVYFLVI